MTAVDTARTPQDLSRVDLIEQWEVDFWCAKFRVSPEELKAHVREVGPNASEIERQLDHARRASFNKGGED